MSSKWALVLGASSGFGAATSIELAKAGYGVFGVHFDMRSTMPNAVAVQDAVKAAGQEAMFFNINAADADKRAVTLDAIREKVGGDGYVRVLMHSLAFGTLLPFIDDNPKARISQMQMDMTLNVMAHSLVYWTQDIVLRGLMGEGGRIFSMTSSGSTRAIFSYGAVSAAKSALESHTRQLAYELAPKGIAANAIRAGVTITAASSKIPGSDKLFEGAALKNPGKRLTTPADVAGALVALCHPAAGWVTGNVINVDGGEEISAG